MFRKNTTAPENILILGLGGRILTIVVLGRRGILAVVHPMLGLLDTLAINPESRSGQL